jgi:hypothetical protein
VECDLGKEESLQKFNWGTVGKVIKILFLKLGGEYVRFSFLIKF